MNLSFFKIGIAASLLLILAVSSCKKSGNQASYMNNAVITGYDLRLCACCGGLLINFSNDTIPYHGTFYDCDNTPAYLGIDSTTVFPVRLKADWKIDSAVCGGNDHILITRFARQ